jgi:hypothetical protein
MLLTNGRFYTMDVAGSIVDTLVVRDGRIVFAGRRAEVSGVATEETIDLRGRSVLPGLVDGHAHLMELARSRFTLDVSHSPSEDAVARRVGEAAALTPPGDWIAGRGWDQNLWPDQRFPTKASLDRVAPGHPVALVRIDGHATWANSAALRVAGVDGSSADPEGGRVVKDGRGAPTGLLIDTAQDLVRRAQPPPSEARFDQAVRDAITECVAKGLTGVHEMGADLAALASYRRLIERGQFPFRNYAAVSGQKAWTFYRERGPEIVGDDRLVVGAIKLWLDGALGSRGAALHAPYCDDPGNRGLILVPPEEVEARSRAAVALGFQVCVHAIGDRANTLALDVFERMQASGPSAAHPARRFRIEHAQVLAQPDVERFRRLGVLPSVQPTHCTSDMPWAVDRLGPERLAGAYAWRSLLATGSIVLGGSDFPVEDPNPFHGLYAAVGRRPLSGEERGWQPEQRMTRDEAVRAFTSWNAAGANRSATLGSLEPGKWADLVVLSDDVFTCPEAAIKDVTPLMTMVGGEIVFRREANGALTGG